MIMRSSLLSFLMCSISREWLQFYLQSSREELMELSEL